MQLILIDTKQCSYKRRNDYPYISISIIKSVSDQIFLRGLKRKVYKAAV